MLFCMFLRYSSPPRRRWLRFETMMDAARSNAPATRHSVAVLGPGCSGLVCQQQPKGNLTELWVGFFCDFRKYRNIFSCKWCFIQNIMLMCVLFADSQTSQTRTLDSSVTNRVPLVVGMSWRAACGCNRVCTTRRRTRPPRQDTQVPSTSQVPTVPLVGWAVARPAWKPNTKGNFLFTLCNCWIVKISISLFYVSGECSLSWLTKLGQDRETKA